MEEVKNVERLAIENSNIAKDEKLKAEEMKKLTSQEIKRAKAREMLVRNEIELAQLREKLAERSKKLVDRKEKVKNLLNLSEANLKVELSQALYNEKVAEIQKQVAEIQRKIAHAETEIEEVNLKLTNVKRDESKGRADLAKKQFKYVKLVNGNAPDEKVVKAKDIYLKKQKDLNEFETDVMEINKEMVEKQNKLANLKKELSEKLAEREKIRPIQNNS
jgi:hypothetical protein